MCVCVCVCVSAGVCVTHAQTQTHTHTPGERQGYRVAEGMSGARRETNYMWRSYSLP